MKTPRLSPAALRPSLTIAASVIALVTVVFGPHLWSGHSGPPTQAAHAQSAPAARESAIPVLVITVRPAAASTSELRAVGTLRPRRHAPVAFAVAGVIGRLEVDEGVAVGEGTPLARLDTVPFTSAVQQAEARVRFLERSLERSENLHAQKALTDEELDAQRAELEATRAQLRLARWSLERAVLRAPFDGHVLVRHVELGQVVAAGTPAFEVAELTTLEFDAALAASDLGSLDVTGPVLVISRDDPRSHARGRVDHAPLRSDQRSGSIPVRIVVENAERTLLPGMVVEARFTSRDTGENGHRVVVPLSALRVDDRGASVWRIEADRVHKIRVELGPVRGEQVLVTGLRPGDLVVDEAPDRLREGDAVVVVSRAEVR
jgi:RND family efflux transporter MFP subunit